MSEIRDHLNTSDEYVSEILRIAAKAIAAAYQTTYDMPKDLPDGWIGIRVDISPEQFKATPKGDANVLLQKMLQRSNLMRHIMPPDISLEEEGCNRDTSL